MVTIYRWTGVETRALREAMQMSVADFAKELKVSVRCIEMWELRGAKARLRASSQRLLDQALSEARDYVVARLAHLLGVASETAGEPDRGSAAVTLASSASVSSTLWGAREADQVWVPAQTAAGEVVFVSMPRRAIVTGIGVGALAAATGMLPVAVLANAADIDHVDHFHRLRLTLIESDNLHGSVSVIPLVEHSIERIGQLRRAGVGDATAMQRIRILYAEFAAWLYQDRRDFDRAQHWTDRALTWSHQLGDSYSIAATLIRKAQIANDRGDGEEAVELAEAAERAAPPGTRFAAVAAAFAGHGAALAGDRASSEAAFDRARELVEDADVDPAWGFFLDHPYIDVHQAHGRIALGDHRGAIDQFGAAIGDMRSGYTRDQAVYLARQSLAHAKAGEHEPAARLGQIAMQVGVSTGSERVLHNLRTVDGLLGADGGPAEVAAFRDAGRRWAVLAS
ncbi:helix-turn-helix domain-containing protein [Nocardia takedensis]|uniref:helix-turn-helix domain-containing protein n=1 Tax=Nocardia takedensis TaxID=259390 RepID=UPI003F7717E7